MYKPSCHYRLGDFYRAVSAAVKIGAMGGLALLVLGCTPAKRDEPLHREQKNICESADPQRDQELELDGFRFDRIGTGWYD